MTLLLGLSAIAAAALGFALLARRNEPARLPLAAMCGCVTAWAMANAVQINAADRDLKRLTVTVAFACICGTVYCFWKAITGRSPWPVRVPPAVSYLLAAPALVTVVLVAAADVPGPFFLELDIPDGTGPVTSTPGPWFVVHMVWAYGLMIWALAGFGWLALQIPAQHRRLSWLMIAAVSAPLLTNAVLITGVVPLDGHDPTPIAVLMACAGLTWGVRRMNMLDVDVGLLPVARDVVVESMTEGVVVVDRRGRIADLNPAAMALLGLDGPEPVGLPVTQIVPGAIGEITDGAGWEFMVARDGEPCTIEARAGLVHARTGGTLVMLRDVTEQRASRSALELSAARHLHASRHDPLTGLPNRTLLFGKLRSELREAEPAVALLILDLDGFKALNDTFGHRAGDRVLRELGVRLENAADAEAIAGRLSGDEFAVVLRTADRTQAIAVAERMLSVFRMPFAVGDTEVTLGASVGVAFGPEHGRDADDLVHAADVAMYHAKRTAGRWAVYQADLDTRRPERLILRHQLRRALEQHELAIHYQPQATTEGLVLAVEALVRWQHPQRGLLMPGAFLPVTEDTELICRLTDEVLDLALADLADWRRETPGMRVSVNISSLDMRDPALPDRVAAALQRHGVPAAALTLEVTENALVVNRDGGEQLELVRRTGVRVALDDFGTGIGPLSTLRELPVDELKIDRSFVAGLDRPRDAALVSGLIRLGHDLGLSVVAEGVESPESVAALRSMGCDLLQGYLVGMPQPRPRRGQETSEREPVRVER